MHKYIALMLSFHLRRVPAAVSYGEPVPFQAPGWNEPHPEYPTAAFYDDYYTK